MHSLYQLILGVTTKLARLVQDQAERETAINRLATAIRDSRELESILQTAANEVGRALKVHSCAVRVEGVLVGRQLTKYYLRADNINSGEASLLGDLNSLSSRLANSPHADAVEGYESQSPDGLAEAVVPLTINRNVIGFLLVRSDDSSRGWADNDLLLLHTVADQLAVAVRQAHMLAQMEQQALTDSLTGCYNRRSLDLRLEQNLQLATRMLEPVSVVVLDIDNFKRVNEQTGHEAGDVALCMLADILRADLRAVDTTARFGGDEFVISLPQADTEGATIVAERLRKRIEEIDVPGFGRVTASFGIATFPNHASSLEDLLAAADRALCAAKKSGRNRIKVAAVVSFANNRLSGELVDAMRRL